MGRSQRIFQHHDRRVNRDVPDLLVLDKTTAAAAEWHGVTAMEGEPSCRFENVRRFFSDMPLTPLFGGTWGLNPIAFDTTLKTTFGSDKVKLSSLKEEKNADAYIVLYGYWNKKDKKLGAHYVTLVQDENGGYLPLNDPTLERGNKEEIREKIAGDGNILAVWSLDF